MARNGASVELQPIDRLEEKIKQLVSMIDTLRSERARATEEIGRLERELESAQARVSAASTASAEVATLKEERELVRNRVVQMLSQIDKLNI